MKRHPRIEAAQAMAGCCVFAYLIFSVAQDYFGFAVSAEQTGAMMLLTATFAAAWLADPQS
jgi:hypothetical protein